MQLDFLNIFQNTEYMLRKKKSGIPPVVCTVLREILLWPNIETKVQGGFMALLAVQAQLGHSLDS